VVSLDTEERGIEQAGHCKGALVGFIYITRG